ncbi:MAG: hypothetical protein Q9226_008710, partial [Calogaya cf. arnoldii]
PKCRKPRKLSSSGRGRGRASDLAGSRGIEAVNQVVECLIRQVEVFKRFWSPRALPSLTTIPQELRLEIYRYLLTTKAAIREPGSRAKRPLYIGVDKRETTGLDPTILRVSRHIYAEALHILYSDNVFAFQSFDCMKAFQSEGIVRAHTFSDDSVYFGRKNAPHGRLTMMRHVEIHFEECSDKYEGELEYTRNRAIREWREFFHPYSFSRDVRFPALSDLTLDFTGLQLRTEAFVVKPIIKKVQTSPGLRRLKVVGLRKRECLEALRVGLVGKKGGFEVIW